MARPDPSWLGLTRLSATRPQHWNSRWIRTLPTVCETSNERAVRRRLASRQAGVCRIRLPCADRDHRSVPVPTALDPRPVAEDQTAGIRDPAAVHLVAHTAKLCRRAGPGRFPPGVRQQPADFIRRGDPVDLYRRARRVRLRTLPISWQLVPVLFAARHAHAAADRRARADVHPVQQTRPDHDAHQRGPRLHHLQPAAGGVDHARLLRGPASRIGRERLGRWRHRATPRSAMSCCR